MSSFLRRAFTPRGIALGLIGVGIVRLLIHLGVSYWLIPFALLGFCFVWALGEMGVDEIKGRRKMRQEQSHDQLG